MKAIQKQKRPEKLCFSCPGNLLLSGEYAVLEEGGWGLGLAPNARAWLFAYRNTETSLDPSEQSYLKLNYYFSTKPNQKGQEGQDYLTSTLDSSSIAHPLLQAVWETFKEKEQILLNSKDSWTVYIDTCAFYDVQGRKFGLGSSAAATLLLCSFFQCLAKPELLPPSLRENKNQSTLLKNKPFPLKDVSIARHAVEAHRAFQGGVGSGYDIMTSFLGGLVSFTGGKKVHAKSFKLGNEDLGHFYLLSGALEQKTQKAIDVWKQYKKGFLEEALNWIQESKLLKKACLRSKSRKEFLKFLEKSKKKSLSLGDRLGIPSTPLSLAPDLGLIKCCGAGQESQILFPELEAQTSVKPCLDIENNKEVFAGRSFLPDYGLCAHPVLQGSGNNKLLLFGEHAVFYGAPALGLGLQEKIDLFLIPDVSPESPSHKEAFRAEGQFTFKPLGQKSGPFFSQSQLSEIQNILDSLGLIPGLSLDQKEQILAFAKTDLPLGSGYGSSSALSTAILKTLGYTKDDLWAQANRLDCIFHGKASGIDAALTLSRALQALKPLKLPASEAPWVPHLSRENLLCPLNVYLVHASLPRSSNTKNLVALMKEKAEARHAETLSALEGLCAVSREALMYFQEELPGGKITIQNLAHLVQEAQNNLELLGLSNAALNSYFLKARALGALAGKLSGAGSGGAFFVLCADLETAQNIHVQWNQLSKTDFSLTLASPARIVYLSKNS